MLLPRPFGATPEELQDQFTSFQQRVHSLLFALNAARARGDAATVANLQVGLRNYQQQVQAAAAALNKAEMPSQLLQTLQSISDDLSAGLGKAVNLLPSLSMGVVGLAVIAGVIYFWALRPKGRKA